VLPNPGKNGCFYERLLWYRLLVAQLKTTPSYYRKRRNVVATLSHSNREGFAPLGIRLELHGLSSTMVSVLRSGEYELPELAICEMLLRKEDRVLEVGSAIGFIGLYCQLRLGIHEYIGVEPHPGTAALLKTNYSRNGLQPRLLSCALTSEDGPIQLSSGSDFWSNHLENTETPSESTITCEGRSLAGLLDAIPFTPTALIVDIEGAEKSVNWEAMPDTVRTMIMELHPHMMGKREAFDLLRRLTKMGFRPTAHAGCTVGLTR
jgi:FkbM family methyltransferase